jgi:ribosomal protein S17
MAGDNPTFKITMKDYEDMNIKVGDKVTIEIKKSDSGSIYT